MLFNKQFEADKSYNPILWKVYTYGKNTHYYTSIKMLAILQVTLQPLVIPYILAIL
jgi:hypothetical protein